MTIDSADQALHHKSCLGEALTAEEHQRLQKWYAQMDAEDSVMLQRALGRHEALMNELQAQIEKVVADIVVEGNKIRALETQTEVACQEIASLKRKLAETKFAQAV